MEQSPGTKKHVLDLKDRHKRMKYRVQGESTAFSHVLGLHKPTRTSPHVQALLQSRNTRMKLLEQFLMSKNITTQRKISQETSRDDDFLCGQGRLGNTQPNRSQELFPNGTSLHLSWHIASWRNTFTGRNVPHQVELESLFPKGKPRNECLRGQRPGRNTFPITVRKISRYYTAHWQTCQNLSITEGILLFTSPSLRTQK